MLCSGLAGGPGVTGPPAEGLAVSARGAWPGGRRTNFLVGGGARPRSARDQGGREQARGAGGEPAGGCWGSGRRHGKVLEEIYSDVLLREGHPSRGSVYKNFPAC